MLKTSHLRLTLFLAVLTGCSGSPAVPPATVLSSAPPGARALVGDSAMTGRALALSLGGLRTAYTTVAEGRWSVMVASAGEVPHAVTKLADEPNALQWTSAGDALVFVERETRVVPGQFDDTNIPHRETLNFSLKRVKLADGTTDVLMTSKAALTVQSGRSADRLLVSSVDTAQRSILTQIDLASGTSKPIADGIPFNFFSLSPDGETVAIVTAEQDGKSVVHLMDLASGETRYVTGLSAKWVRWLPDGRLFIGDVDYAAEKATLWQFTRYGEALSAVPLLENPGGLAPGDSISPVGDWLLAAGKESGMAAVSLKTGEVVRSAQSGWVGFLPAGEVIGLFAGGLYTWPFAQAFDLSQLSATPAAARRVTPDMNGPWGVIEPSDPRPSLPRCAPFYAFSDPDDDGRDVTATRPGFDGTLRGNKSIEGRYTFVGDFTQGGETTHEVLEVHYDASTRWLIGQRGNGVPPTEGGRGSLPIDLAPCTP